MATLSVACRVISHRRTTMAASAPPATTLGTGVMSSLNTQTLTNAINATRGRMDTGLVNAPPATAVVTGAI